MKNRGVITMALVLMVLLLGVAGLAGLAGLAVYMFGFKPVMTWMLMSIGTLQFGIATSLAAYLIDSERWQKVITGCVGVAVPVEISLGAIGLFRGKDVFTFALCILQSWLYILLFVFIVSVIWCAYRLFTE